MKNILSFIFVIAIAGCMVGTTPSSFFMLSSVNVENVQPISKKQVAFSVEVNIPEYIDRPQIVTKGESDTEFNMSEFNRWIEPLRSSIERVMAENLSLYMSEAKVKPSSMGMRNPDYRVVLDIDEFDGRLNGKVYLRVWWSIVNNKNEVIYFDDAIFENETGPTYTDFTQTQSDLLGRLSIKIAKKFNKI